MDWNVGLPYGYDLGYCQWRWLEREREGEREKETRQCRPKLQVLTILKAKPFKC
jgi:hypothetical protein